MPDDKQETSESTRKTSLRLAEALATFNHRVRLNRGRGGASLDVLRRRLQLCEANIDPETAEQLGEILNSVIYAVEDAQHDAQKARRQPWSR